MIVEQVHYQPPQPSAVGRARYLIIGAVTVLAVGVGVVLGSVLVGGGSAGLAPAAAYAPADAVMYAEARLDLPGAQRANLRALLDRFPAADADAILTDVLADTLDDALAEGGAPIDYSNDVAPWFEGTLAMVLLDYPMNMTPEEMRLPSTVALFGVRDAAAATAVADTLRGELEGEGSSFSSSDHGGVTIWSLEVEDVSAFAMPMDGVGFAYAVTDDQLVLGNGTDAVVAALDARGGSGLAEAGDVAGLLSALPAERAGTMVMHTAAMLAEMRASLDAMRPGLADALDAYLDAVPPYSVGSLAFEEDAVLVNEVAGVPDGDLRPGNGERGFAERLPADTLFYADASQLGPALEQAVVAGKASATLLYGDETLATLGDVESALGADLEEFVAWIGAGSVAAGWTDDAPWFGLVLEATDVDAASRRLAQIRALADLASGQGDVDVTVGTETIDGVEVTTLSVGSGMPGTSVDRVELQYALDGDVALLGMSGFVEAALTRDPAGSLAADARFAAALDRFGGEDNAGAFYLDLAGLVDTIRGEMPAEETAGMEEVWPNVAPLDYIAAVSRVDGDRVVTRLGLVLR